MRRAVGQGASTLLLFGTCGALVEVGPVPMIGSVRDVSGRTWTPTVVPPPVGGGHGAVTASVVGVDHPVGTPSAKADLHARTGADLVDCESHVFAQACAHAGVRWGVIRAVSDGPGDELAEGIETWVTPDGRTRLGRVLWACVRSPTTVVSLLKLARRSGAALRLAAQTLATVVGERSSSGDHTRSIVRGAPA
ncbi:MAG: hypothetical protein ACKVZJ_11100 [Phycisphaerales bacterium]